MKRDAANQLDVIVALAKGPHGCFADRREGFRQEVVELAKQSRDAAQGVRDEMAERQRLRKTIQDLRRTSLEEEIELRGRSPEWRSSQQWRSRPHGTSVLGP